MERLARITHQELQTSKQSEGKVQSFEGLRQGMSLQSANWRDLPQEGHLILGVGTNSIHSREQPVQRH